MALKIIYILREVREKFILFLEESYKSMGRREFFGRWEDVFCNRIENGRIVFED